MPEYDVPDAALSRLAEVADASTSLAKDEAYLDAMLLGMECFGRELAQYIHAGEDAWHLFPAFVSEKRDRASFAMLLVMERHVVLSWRAGLFKKDRVLYLRKDQISRFEAVGKTPRGHDTFEITAEGITTRFAVLTTNAHEMMPTIVQGMIDGSVTPTWDKDITE